MSTKRTKLRALRHDRGLSQVNLAEEIGVSRESISLWERGIADPHPHYVKKLCAFFEKEASELELGTTRKIQRRQLLEQVAHITGVSLLPIPMQIDSIKTSSAVDKLHLENCEQLIKTCWQLLRVDGLVAVGHLIPTFLPSLDTAAKYPSIYQKDTASLAAQGYIIYGLVAVLQMNYTLAEEHCKRAIIYSRIAEDKNLEVASLKHLATKYLDIGLPQKMRSTYQQALPTVNEISPLLRSRTYLGLAISFAQCGQTQEAWKYFGRAQETFPEKPENDQGFIYADCGVSSFNHYAGLMHLEFDQPQKAWQTFADIHKLNIEVPERTIIEITNCQAEAAIAKRDLELATIHIKAGITGALKIKSEKRWNDAYLAYKKMRLVWPHEQRVKDLPDLFYSERYD